MGFTWTYFVMETAVVTHEFPGSSVWPEEQSGRAYIYLSILVVLIFPVELTWLLD